MAQVSSGAATISPSYIDISTFAWLAAAARLPALSGVQYGRLVEAARAEIETSIERPWHTRWLRAFLLPRERLLPSRLDLGIHRAAGLFVPGQRAAMAGANARLFATQTS